MARMSHCYATTIPSNILPMIVINTVCPGTHLKVSAMVNANKNLKGPTPNIEKEPLVF